MKKSLALTATILSIATLAACSNSTDKSTESSTSTSQSTTEQSSSTTSYMEHYSDLIDLALSVQEWLNYPNNTGTTAAINATGEYLLVKLPLDLSTASEEAVLKTGENIKEILDNTYETAKLTKEEIPRPLLKVMDENDVTYIIEQEDGTLVYQKP